MNATLCKHWVVIIFFLWAGGLHAQAPKSQYWLDVDKHMKEQHFSTSRGTVSQPDTITLSQGRYSGRYNIWFDGPGRNFFKVVEPTGKWIKVKKFEVVKVLVVFDPPASFKGETHAKLHLDAPSGPRAWMDLVGNSTD